MENKIVARHHTGEFWAITLKVNPVQVVGIDQEIGYIGNALYHAPPRYSSASLSTAIITTTGDKSDNEIQMLEDIRSAILNTLEQPWVIAI